MTGESFSPGSHSARGVIQPGESFSPGSHSARGVIQPRESLISLTVVTAGEFIVGHDKVTQFARCFYDKMGPSSLNAHSTTICSTSSTHCQHKMFWGKKFL